MKKSENVGNIWKNTPNHQYFPNISENFQNNHIKMPPISLILSVDAFSVSLHRRHFDIIIDWGRKGGIYKNWKPFRPRIKCDIIYIDMIETHTIENKDEIEELVKQHRFKGTQFRVNFVADAETYALPNGRLALKKRIKSDIKKEGPLFDAVKTQTMD